MAMQHITHLRGVSTPFNLSYSGYLSRTLRSNAQITKAFQFSPFSLQINLTAHQIINFPSLAIVSSIWKRTFVSFELPSTLNRYVQGDPIDIDSCSPKMLDDA